MLIINNINRIISNSGLILSFFGSLCLIRGSFITSKKAVELALSRYGSEKYEENLKLPVVKNLLNQRNWALTGTILLTLGFFLQIFLK
jgi:hypothetical protein